ncbi:hypothetical protein GCM10022222_40450 [Amycolatopsis ultiminotia]|uniref:Uncharacterized protein n=1 Tax=Amycolatopsis ultiminotia TaxID=543629 RepID=A0ABP6WPL0_9PSEU
MCAAITGAVNTETTGVTRHRSHECGRAGVFSTVVIGTVVIGVASTAANGATRGTKHSHRRSEERNRDRDARAQPRSS